MTIGFSYEQDAIKVSGLPLWLDSSDFRAGSKIRRPLNFISHAHADHIGNHKRIICSKPTRDLLKLRVRTEEVIALDWEEPYDIAGATIRLYPAGHILGSAQILIEKDGFSICYTGDFRLGSGLTTEECAPVSCDLLLMECTYGHPKYQFPPREKLLESISDFIESCFDENLTPVLLGYSLGKAQEAIKACHLLEYSIATHPNIMKLCDVYKKHGIDFGKLITYGKRPLGRRVVVFPPDKRARMQLGSPETYRTAILTGWAQDGWRRRIYGADEMIPYSDHSDFSQLIETAKLTGANKILTHHGDAVKFADHLQAAGLNAEPLIPSDQGRLF